MITRISGTLENLAGDVAVLAVEPFHYEVMVPEFTRRQLQLKTGESIQLHTIHYIEGNAAQGGRLTPRLIGFLSEIEREFFELFCSVDGVGTKKALRAMVRPVQEVATMIENQNAEGMASLPGIGPATAERVIAKLRRKMPKFALLVTAKAGAQTVVETNLVEESFQLLCKLGHSEVEAQRMLDRALESKKKYKDVESLLSAVYQLNHGE